MVALHAVEMVVVNHAHDLEHVDPLDDEEDA